MLEFDPETSEWTEPLARGYPPCPRWSASLTACGGALVVFGGMGIREEGMRAACQSDCHRFEPATGQWSQVVTAPDPNEKHRPAARRGHVACAMGYGTLLIHGGIGPDPLFGREVLYGDMHSLDLARGQWHSIRPTGDAPRPRAFHAAAAQSSETLFLFGGRSSPLLLAATRIDAWNLSRSTLPPTNSRKGISSPALRSEIERLRRRYGPGRAPSVGTGSWPTRPSSAAASVAAGIDGDGLAEPDMFKFEAQRQHWTRLCATGTPPVPRHGHAMDFVGSKHTLLAVYGGMTARGPSNEVFLFDTGARRRLAPTRPAESRRWWDANYMVALQSHALGAGLCPRPGACPHRWTCLLPPASAAGCARLAVGPDAHAPLTMPSCPGVDAVRPMPVPRVRRRQRRRSRPAHCVFPAPQRARHIPLAVNSQGRCRDADW